MRGRTTDFTCIGIVCHPLRRVAPPSQTPPRRRPEPGRPAGRNPKAKTVPSIGSVGDDYAAVLTENATCLTGTDAVRDDSTIPTCSAMSDGWCRTPDCRLCRNVQPLLAGAQPRPQAAGRVEADYCFDLAHQLAAASEPGGIKLRARTGSAHVLFHHTAQPTARGAPSQKRDRMAFLSGLPSAVTGTESTISMCLGD